MSTDSSLEKKYKDEIVSQMQKSFAYKNVNLVPRLKKIVVSTCIGKAVQDKKILDKALEELTLITGQKAVLSRAKKSIANFKLRQGMPIGCYVTLRNERMYEFLNRLVNIVLPRMRDFRGISSKFFDGRGNYTFGITEQIVFPEIEYDKIDQVYGLNITLVTSARNDEEGRQLLTLFGMPFSIN